ncbi:MAG: hypothetical protein RBT02_00415 [Bacteroidales bacterium]|jgi:hypothetical protein|nr:hypothetical protein [Bacteroidales bacterium]
MFTPGAIRHYLRLLVLSLLMIILIILVNRFQPSLYNPASAVALAGGFSLTAFISLLIFFNGFASRNERGVLLTLIALGIKLLISLILALLYLVVFKNDQTGSVILFFVLYLAFTFYVIRTFICVLKRI